MLMGSRRDAPFITVVMPVRNEACFIGDTLRQLLNQTYPIDRYEIIVADGMSDDGTRDIVQGIHKNHPQVKLFDNTKRLSSAGRNVGFKNGQGDCFLVVDGHCFIPTEEFLGNISECFEKSGADCLGRPQPLDPPGLTWLQQAIAIARGSKLGHGGDSLIYSDFEGYSSAASNGAAYRREVFAAIGYVDELFDACEDLEFNYRLDKAGLKTYMSPKLTVRYYPRANFKGLFRQMARYGRGRFRFMQKHPDALTVNQLIPGAFVAGLILAVFVSIALLVPPLVTKQHVIAPQWHQLIVLLFVSPYVLYVILVLGESIRLAAQKGWSYLFKLPLIFFTVHLGLGWGFLLGALLDQKKIIR